jgi:phosphatidylserine/phosphatidylglycerophosphate/cardiolipin synthase-like enzyme
MVWTGSTNLTPSGFLGQTNVGHILDDPAAAKKYFAYWKLLSGDPEKPDAKAGAMNLTPDPPTVVAESSTSLVFSPRNTTNLLNWYGQRMEDATEAVMLTSAFGVSKELAPYLAEQSDILRFLLAEKPPTKKIRKALDAEPDVIVSYGTALGEMYRFDKKGVPRARDKIAEFDLDKWFLKEEHFRKANEGMVFFVHTKFLLIDPLSDDPLVCTGSANFSPNSLTGNDENMMIIRGDTRVADIYLTEFDRIFRHFYARDIINELAAKGAKATKPFLATTSRWTAPYFKDGTFKSRRRKMFFAHPATTWVDNASSR